MGCICGPCWTAFTLAGGSGRLEPAPGARIFPLSGALRCRGIVLFVVAGCACLVCGPSSADPALPFARACRPCRHRLLLRAGDQTVACAVYAPSRSLHALLKQDLGCAQ